MTDVLKTPEHEKMLLWLVDKKNVTEVTKECGCLNDWLKHDKETKNSEHPSDTALASNVKAEVPVLAYNKHNIGFVDAEVRVEHRWWMKDRKGWCTEKKTIRFEIKPTIQKGKRVNSTNQFLSNTRR